jgi:cytochrome c553
MTKFALLSLLCGALMLAGQAQAADVEAGKKKAADACADCHGEDGKGDKDTPSIAGMNPDEFTKAMKEYQAGTRTKSKKMIKSAQKASDEDIADTAAYYATLPK